MKLEIMDTTLRDGEQTSGVSFNAPEKLNIAKILLEEVKVDRIEIASARVSEGELEAVQKITEWARENNYLESVEILGFIDKNASLDWINDAGAKVVNLLAKGSLKHVKEQLRKTPEEHLADLEAAIEYATSKGIICNLYLEDWSNGMIHSPEYVYFLADTLKDRNLKRLMLPDTLGILNHEQTYEFSSILLQNS